MTKLLRTGCAIFAIAFSLLHADPANAQTYPRKTVRIIVPSTPGGGVDSATRILAQKLAKQWNQAVVIDNRPGANSMVAENTVANAEPDGHTILIVNAQRAINAAHPIKSGGYDMVNGLKAVTKLGTQPQVLVSKKYSSLKALVDAARSRPGQISYGDSGAGSANDLAMKQFMRLTNTDLFQVSYKTQADSTLGVLRGDIDVVQGSVLLLAPPIKAGTAKALAVTSKGRSKVMPEVPTVFEAIGVDFQFYGWLGFFLPAKTPENIVAQISTDIREAVKDPSIRERLELDGLEIVANSPENFQAQLAAEIQTWKSVIKPAP